MTTVEKRNTGAYLAIVRRLAVGGDEPAETEIETALTEAGRTLDDLRSDVATVRAYLRDRAGVARVLAERRRLEAARTHLAARETTSAKYVARMHAAHSANPHLAELFATFE